MDIDAHIDAPHFDGDTAFAAAGQGGLASLQRGDASIPAGLVAQVVESVIGRLACDLRPDYHAAFEAALARETHPRGRAVLGQLLENARIAAHDRVPLCQDTGYVWVLLEVAGDVLVPATVFDGVDAAVARAYEAAGLRRSIVYDALLDRANTGDNTPAFCEVKVVGQGTTGQKGTVPLSCWGSQDKGTVPFCPVRATLHVMLKGGGSDNASRVVMLPPGAGLAGVKDAVLAAVREKGANACPPLVVGVGVGSTFDKVGGLAKHALLRAVGHTNPNPRLQDIEQELLEAVNALGIGPGGFGGNITALAVHIETAPSHIAALPVAVNIGCTALRSVSIDLLAGPEDGGAGAGVECELRSKPFFGAASMSEQATPAPPSSGDGGPQ